MRQIYISCVENLRADADVPLGWCNVLREAGAGIATVLAPGDLGRGL